MKADEWIDWMVTASIEAVDGLLDATMMKIWQNFRKGIMIYLTELTLESREEAKLAFKEGAIQLEEVKIY